MFKVKYTSKSNILSNISPTRLIVFSFAAIILVGAFLLMLPIASNDGKSESFANALFTATSATCVTGLVIADTKTQWTVFGQVVILFLIQAGGLGIITLATFFSVLMGKKVSLKGMLLAQESISYFDLVGILKLIRKLVIVTLSVEAIGAILLSTRFVPKFGLVQGIYMGIFHSVSAFCNAGFDIIGDYKSLTEYNADPIVLYTIGGLIICGGLGFMVWKDLYHYRKTKQLLLHTKVVLTISVILILVGTWFFFFLEYNNPATLQNMPFGEKLNASIFHSITCRTAGYNSLPLDRMTELSKIITIILMFIGAAPGSTGGGVKVTTVGVLGMAVLSQINGSDHTVIHKHKVPHNVINKALTIISLSALLVMVITILILALEQKPLIDVLYEATSAFGTVGLSSLGTPNVGNISKYLLILTMFLGRVGPLSFAIALSLKNKSHAERIYPEGKIAVG